MRFSFEKYATGKKSGPIGAIRGLTMLYILGLGLVLAVLMFAVLRFADVNLIFNRYYGIPILILIYATIATPIVLFWHFEFSPIETDQYSSPEGSRRQEKIERRSEERTERSIAAEAEAEAKIQEAEARMREAAEAAARAQSAKQEAEATIQKEEAAAEAQAAKDSAEVGARMKAAEDTQAQAQRLQQEAEARIIAAKIAEENAEVAKAKAERAIQDLTAERHQPDRTASPEGTSTAGPETVDRHLVRIFYATNRMPISTGGRADYSGERADNLSYGTAYVRVPQSHKYGEDVTRPFGMDLWVWKYHVVNIHFQENPNEHFTIEEVITKSEQEFYDQLNNFDEKTSAVIFIHGYHNSFDDGLYKFSQIVFDGGFQSMAPILFSWPSRGGLFNYKYDEGSAELSVDFLLELIDALQSRTKIKTVHIIAHSMGNRIALGALSRLYDRTPWANDKHQVGEIALAAPDVDRDIFCKQAKVAVAMAKGVTLYASSNDRAMEVSGLGGLPRAGDVPTEGPIFLQGMDSIDVSDVGSDLFALNHGTFANETVIPDVSLVLKTDLRPPSLRSPRIQPLADSNLCKLSESSKDAQYWKYTK
jgi:esterase/lipase superfamily enzyme